MPLSLLREKWYNTAYAFLKKELPALTRFCTLFSGSSGNAVYLSTDRGSVLIDCGMSGKQTLEAMSQNGLKPEEL